MSLITETELTQYMGCGSQQLVEDAQALLEGLLGVDDLEEKTYDTIGMVKNSRIIVTNFPITEIQEIGGVAYSGEEPKNYQISKNIINFTDPGQFSKYVTCRRVKIKYVAGYKTTGSIQNVPKDLKLAVKMLGSGLYNHRENHGTVSCKIGQEAFQFASITEMEDFKKILNKYRKRFISVI